MAWIQKPVKANSSGQQAVEMRVVEMRVVVPQPGRGAENWQGRCLGTMQGRRNLLQTSTKSLSL